MTCNIFVSLARMQREGKKRDAPMILEYVLVTRGLYTQAMPVILAPEKGVETQSPGIVVRSFETTDSWVSVLIFTKV